MYCRLLGSAQGLGMRTSPLDEISLKDFQPNKTQQHCDHVLHLVKAHYNYLINSPIFYDKKNKKAFFRKAIINSVLTEPHNQNTLWSLAGCFICIPVSLCLCMYLCIFLALFISTCSLLNLLPVLESVTVNSGAKSGSWHCYLLVPSQCQHHWRQWIKK